MFSSSCRTLIASFLLETKSKDLELVVAVERDLPGQTHSNLTLPLLFLRSKSGMMILLAMILSAKGP